MREHPDRDTRARRPRHLSALQSRGATQLAQGRNARLPVRLAHHLLAYFWMLNRDADRLQDCFRRIDVLPLGSGAVAGVSYPIDRLQVAEALGFSAISENSVDAVGDRDFAIETVAAAALLMVHLARWAGELVTWASEEFGFVRLADAVSHGSSIMPQKKNPDALELVRARAGRHPRANVSRETI